MRLISMKKYFFILLLASMPTTGVNADENFEIADRKLTNQIFTQGEIIDRYSLDSPRRYTIIFKKKVYSCTVVYQRLRTFWCWSDKRF